MDDGWHCFGVDFFGGGVVWFPQFLVDFLVTDRGWDDAGSSPTCP